MAQAGLKWLQQAGFGTDSSYSSADDSESDIHTHPLRRLRVTYDPQILYSTFHFTVPPILAERLPIPSGYSAIQYLYYSQIVGTAFAISESEGNTSTHFRSMNSDTASHLIMLGYY
jgi:hypothetical protein